MKEKQPDNIIVKGKVIDDQTRCTHYHSERDIIAIKFACCSEYYPCYTCHQETAGHPPAVWPANAFDTKAILCGNCKQELTINAYFESNNTCPHCAALFNPGCAKHYHLYFQVPTCSNK